MARRDSAAIAYAAIVGLLLAVQVSTGANLMWLSGPALVVVIASHFWLGRRFERELREQAERERPINPAI